MSTANQPNYIFLSGEHQALAPEYCDRRFFVLPQKFEEHALDAGVAAWFGVTKVEAENNFIRSRMSAAVQAVISSLPAGKTNFRSVSGMNAAFGNPQGQADAIDWDRIRKQCLNVTDELGELFIALGSDPVVVKDLVQTLKRVAASQVADVLPDGVRDALCDIQVFSYGAHHLMGVDADADIRVVLDGVMTRFIKDEADKEATIAKHAAAGVTAVYFEGDFPTMVMKSSIDQPDAPKGKFLKSASYREPVFAALPAQQEGGAA
jgi:hypothetical protein